ncbi:MAG: hypothetical protein U1E91_01740 [Moraxella sp.]
MPRLKPSKLREANRRVAQASKTGYDLGVRSMVDTLLAERQYHAAKRDLINAYFGLSKCLH